MTTREWGHGGAYLPTVLMNDTFQERVLNSPEVCRNCFRTVRVERTRPNYGRFDVTVESSRYSRDRRTTTIEYAPAADVGDHKGVFCTCGVEGSFDRVWDTADVTRDRFREFIKAVLRSLERQGLSLDRQRVATRALGDYDHGDDVDDALASGVAAGLSVRSSTKRQTA